MNGKQYEAILSALADKLIDSERELQLKEFEIERLKRKLAEAEYHLNPTEANAKKLEIR